MALVQLVSDSICRITGVSLAAGADIVVALSDGAGDILLPAAYKPRPYFNARLQEEIDLAASQDVEVVAAATGVATAIPISVVKASTTDPTAWTATLTNTHGSIDSPMLEIYIKFHN